MLTVPFMRLGTLAFHKLGFDKPLLPQSKRAATLLFHCIENNARNCQAIYTAVPSLEPAARKPIGIGEVLQQVFAEVPAETPQIEFWLEMLAKARKGTTSDGPDLPRRDGALAALCVLLQPTAADDIQPEFDRIQADPVTCVRHHRAYPCG